MNRTLVLGAKKGKRVALTVGFALAYYLAAKLGLVVAYGSSMASPVWPSSGLALAAVLLLGVEVWPGIFVGAFVANLFAALGDAAVTLPQSLEFAAIVGLGNALEAVLAAWLLRLANGGQSLLDCASNAFRFAAAALAASGVASSIGAVASCLSNVVSWAEFGVIWFTWFVGDSVGILVVCTLILTWAEVPARDRGFGGVKESRAFFAALLLVSLMLFSGVLDGNPVGSMPYLVIPVLLWAAHRLGHQEVATGVAIISVLAIWATAHGNGPFASASPDDALLLLQVFIGVTVVSLTALSASYRQGRRAELTLREEKDRAQTTLDSIGEAVVAADRFGNVHHMNLAAQFLTGWTLAQARGKPIKQVVKVVDAETGRPVLPLVKGTQANSPFLQGSSTEILVSRDGREHLVESTLTPPLPGRLSADGPILIIRDVTHQKRLADRVEYHSKHDPLTGLPNRQAFEARVGRAVDAARTLGVQHVLGHLGIDSFKLVNDSAGHMAGDALLQQLGVVIRGCVTELNCVARTGGDEFGLLLEECSLNQGREIAQRIVDAVADYRLSWGGRSLQVGVSIGLAAITPATRTSTEVLTEANVACYTAKELGRSRFHVYGPGEDESHRRHREIFRAAGLRGALDEDRFELYCQPILPVGQVDTEWPHYEVLLRLRIEDGTLVSAGDFMPAAEQFGISAAVDRWVIRNLLRQYGEVTGHDPVRLSVNLSGSSLAEGTLLTYVNDELEETEVAPEVLSFEITETAAIHNLHNARQFIEAVRGRGSRVSLDDFGSGLSSFRYLKNLTVDYLKIDGGIVSHIAVSPSDLGMVTAINDIGRVLGVKTIGEHVHDGAVLECLREVGVDYAQGYFLGRPMPLDMALKTGVSRLN